MSNIKELKRRERCASVDVKKAKKDAYNHVVARAKAELANETSACLNDLKDMDLDLSDDQKDKLGWLISNLIRTAARSGEDIGEAKEKYDRTGRCDIHTEMAQKIDNWVKGD